MQHAVTGNEGLGHADFQKHELKIITLFRAVSQQKISLLFNF